VEDPGVAFLIRIGLGRTGRWFAAEHYGLKLDFLVLGKRLTGGYIAISAVGCRQEHIETIEERAGNFVHGHTYSHHAVAAAAAVATLEILERENLIDQVQRRGLYLEKILKPLRHLHHVGDIRGIGLMWAIEFVEDSTSLKTFDRSERLTERIYVQLIDSGVITYKCTGFVGGNGDALMLGPPYGGNHCMRHGNVLKEHSERKDHRLPLGDAEGLVEMCRKTGLKEGFG